MIDCAIAARRIALMPMLDSALLIFACRAGRIVSVEAASGW